VFLERPICAGFLALSLLFLIAVLLPAIRTGRRKAFQDG
jgi:TctA family transporter